MSRIPDHFWTREDNYFEVYKTPQDLCRLITEAIESHFGKSDSLVLVNTSALDHARRGGIYGGREKISADMIAPVFIPGLVAAIVEKLWRERS